ncbi:BnaC09g43130D [Brassica napus]|uniref:Ubiquitin-like domain-containing protein n=2 Tax=Brassica TaxID=3705 RepID=A0A3P6EEM2_BRAOL|nr:unnamed protein product [Brassica napus]CDY09848.1 BnaC09g43130D [Brassica napus]VDD33794.1 unnamed protein product [Brassica oleracea]
MIKFKSKRFEIRFGFGKRTNNKGTQEDQQQKGFGNNSNEQESDGEDLISIRVSTFAHFNDLSIEATFGELKMVLTLLTGLEPKQQRLLFNGEYPHMVGVTEKKDMFLLEGPALTEKRLIDLNNISTSCPTIIV